MEHRQNRRAQQTRERLRTAPHRLFLKQVYLVTSIDAILAEADISSEETLYLCCLRGPSVHKIDSSVIL
jgi:hypothetical protein